jgi:carboxylesterase type B
MLPLDPARWSGLRDALQFGPAAALADKVSGAWIAFARNGKPSTPNLPAWPALNATQSPTMVFDNESHVQNDPTREHRLAMFGAMNFE